MKIVTLGSGGEILDTDQFLDYCDIQFVGKAHKIENGLFSCWLLFSLRIYVIVHNKATKNTRKYTIKIRDFDGPQHYGSSFPCSWFRRCVFPASVSFIAI